MNNPTLREAYERFAISHKDETLFLVLENGLKIPFHELDFESGGDNSDHVWLYQKRIRFACIDMRSVSGIMVETIHGTG